MTTEYVDHPTLCHLVDAEAISGTHVVGTTDGWALRIRYGVVERTLVSHSGQTRQFKKLETLVSYLKKVGIAHFDVDASHFSVDSMNRITRPDRSEALKRVHAVAASLTQAYADPDGRPGQAPHREDER